MVTIQIEDLRLDINQIDFYAGAKYREHLMSALEQKGILGNIPLRGKRLGEQLQFYKKNIK